MPWHWKTVIILALVAFAGSFASSAMGVLTDNWGDGIEARPTLLSAVTGYDRFSVCILKDYRPRKWVCGETTVHHRTNQDPDVVLSEVVRQAGVKTEWALCFLFFVLAFIRIRRKKPKKKSP